MILPGYFSKKSTQNVNFEDYNATMKAFNINPLGQENTDNITNEKAMEYLDGGVVGYCKFLRALKPALIKLFLFFAGLS